MIDADAGWPHHRPVAPSAAAGRDRYRTVRERPASTARACLPCLTVTPGPIPTTRDEAVACVDMDRTLLDRVRSAGRAQDDVLTVSQLVDLGVGRNTIDRRAADGTWRRLHRGVVVVHSGPVPWRTRARAALLRVGPGAALSDGSAGYVLGFSDRPRSPIEVAVPDHRRVTDPGIRVTRRRHLDVTSVRGLSVTSRGWTVTDLVSAARTDDDAVAIVCAALRAGTHPEQILTAAAGRSRLPGRALLMDLLRAVDDGIESPLELRYHRDVEVRHGLPRAVRQEWERLDGRWIRSDARYERHGVRVELDGRLAHPDGRTDADTWRDNAVLIAHGEMTLRYRWVHVVGEPCRTTAQVVAALRSRGWRGRGRACGPACALR